MHPYTQGATTVFDMFILPRATTLDKYRVEVTKLLVPIGEPRRRKESLRNEEQLNKKIEFPDFSSEGTGSVISVDEIDVQVEE